MTRIGKRVLPVDPYLEPIREAWQRGQSIIVKAAPGSGKSTRVPAFLASHSEKIVVVLEPRRLAARLSAEWVATENNSSVGGFAGYQVRFDRKSSPATKVLFVTEGIFLNLLVSDPGLSAVSTVVIDEFHERHINTDIALAVITKLQATVRPDLRIIIMSATIDTGSLESYLTNAGVFDIPGKTFPVAISYHPGNSEKPSVEHLALTTKKIIQDPGCTGNVLVFATGMREIRDVLDVLSRTIDRQQVDLFSLSSETSREDQNRIFSEGGKRRIVFSTNVAETSLTIPGVTGIVDNGLAKISGYAEWNGMATLDIRKISKASCIQRAGRAGRTSAGVCYRAYSEGDFLGRKEYTVPEIQRTDLSDLALTLCVIGVIDRCESDAISSDLNWFETPAPLHLFSAVALLKLIGAVDGAGCLTSIGRRMAELPLSPRLAATYISGLENGIGELTAAAAAVIGESGIQRYNAQPPVAHDCDVEYQSECLLKVLSGQKLTGAEQQYIDAGKLRTATRVWTQLTRKNTADSRKITDHMVSLLKKALLAGFPDRVAQRKTSTQRNVELYGFCNGGGGVLSRASVLQNVDLMIAVAGTLTHAKSGDVGVSIEIASGIKLADLTDAPAQMKKQTRVVRWNDRYKKSEVVVSERYGDIVLNEKIAGPKDDPDRAECSALLALYLKENWEEFCHSNSALSQYLLRSALLNRFLAEGFPQFTGDMRDLFIEIICDGRWSVDALSDKELKNLINEQLNWDQNQILERKVPDQIVLSGSRKFPVTYRSDAPPLVRGFIQDFYGMPDDITILDGQIVLAIELIGPNKRPLQITSSLKGFWTQTYPQLKTEFSRKYPRHFWPEQPELAPPVLLKSRLPK